MNKEVQRLMLLFEGSFINSLNELILVPKTNLYFRLEDVATDKDLKCKVIAWRSRAACKAMPYYVHWRNEEYQKSVRDKINAFLGTNFSAEEWLDIYTYLGNDIRRELCEKFIDSGYDLNVIKEGVKK